MEQITWLTLPTEEQLVAEIRKAWQRMENDENI